MNLSDLEIGFRQGNISTAEVQETLGIDAVNANYFLVLLSHHFSASHSRRIRLHEGGPIPSGETVAFPTATAPAEILATLPWTPYASLASNEMKYAVIAKGATLWVKKMHAGTGSSIRRDTYLASLNRSKSGAKGTDLFVSLGSEGTLRSLAELQLLQSLSVACENTYASVLLQDIVSSETAESVEDLWRRPCYFSPTSTYEAWVAGQKNIGRVPSVFQAYLPTLDTSERLSTDRMAPGGHALFGVEAIHSAIWPERLPLSGKGPLVACLANGEDLCAFPDPAMIGWMCDRNIPIAMVTTEKTAIDRKGGQLAILRSTEGEVYVALVESAQAKEAGQLELFEKLGLDLKSPGQFSFFNTNMALFNYQALVPALQELEAKIGKKALLAAVAPDLIRNRKEQGGRAFVQLEGALGSVLLNLDRVYRRECGKPLVSFLNIDRARRTQFFSPIKTAFDFLLQFHSDRFEFDKSRMKLRDRRPGTLPLINLRNFFYDDISNVLSAFKEASLIGLDELKVEGICLAPGCVFRGRVELISRQSGPVDVAANLRARKDWPSADGCPILENCKLEF